MSDIVAVLNNDRYLGSASRSSLLLSLVTDGWLVT